MTNHKPEFNDYLKASKELFRIIFGEDVYKQLERTKLKPFKWEGIDITTSEILAVMDNVRERFTRSSIEYHKERDRHALDLLILTIFHYGYQSCCDHNNR